MVKGGDGNTIYKATYSGVPVFEFICRDVAVMRRRSDAYLNATQILKVAGFDKPQRTRILEREIQKGEHEKIQGGYGKFQGTWIPIERGLALSKQYGVEDLLRPIIDYVPTSVSPPPAPKHAVAAPSRARKDKEKRDAATPLKTGPTSAAALQARAQLAQKGTNTRKRQAAAAAAAAAAVAATVVKTPVKSSEKSDDGSLADSPHNASTSSATPSPVPSHNGDRMDMDGMTMSSLGPGSSAHKRSASQMLDGDMDHYDTLQQVRGQSAVHTPRQSPHRLGMGMEPPTGPEQYTDIILNYFVSETSQIPQLFVSPPPDFDPNASIDEDGHTALHWACAMGRVRVVKLLLSGGASIFRPNNAEQTPLMRSVMFSNNYDVRKFAELYELLHRSTLNIDKSNRTVFHHIANLALTKGKTHAARYYMETILGRLADYPQELADVINFQDEDGETALTLAARARSRRLVKALLDHGADPKIKNRDFKSAEDYILEDERFRSSPIPGSGATRKETGVPEKTPVYQSEAAKLAGGNSLQDISAHMQSLARSFDAELQAKERSVLQAKALLNSIHAEITETSRLIQNLEGQAGPADETRRELEGLQQTLKAKFSEALRAGFQAWAAGQDVREGEWRSGAGGDFGDLEQDHRPAEGGPAEEDRLRWEIGEKRRKRDELVTELVKAEAENADAKQIEQYRQLVATGCGNFSAEEIDNMLPHFLETFESEATQTGGGAAGAKAEQTQSRAQWVS